MTDDQCNYGCVTLPLITAVSVIVQTRVAESLLNNASDTSSPAVNHIGTFWFVAETQEAMEGIFIFLTVILTKRKKKVCPTVNSTQAY